MNNTVNDSMDYNEDLILDASERIREWRKEQSVSDPSSIVKLSQKLLAILNKVDVKEPDFLFDDDNLASDYVLILELLLSGEKYERLFNENNEILNFFVDNVVGEGYFLCNEILNKGN